MKSPLPLGERVRVRGYVKLFHAFVLVHSPSKAPSEEEVEISPFKDLLKIGPFAHIEPQNYNPSQAYPGTYPKASKEPFKIVIPRIPGIEKQSSPDGLKGELSNGKTDGEIVNQRKPQLVIY